jgi:hypothetical protein
MSDLFEKLKAGERRRYGALQSLIRAQHKLDHAEFADEGGDAFFAGRAEVTDAAHDFVEASIAFDRAEATFEKECEEDEAAARRGFLAARGNSIQ